MGVVAEVDLHLSQFLLDVGACHLQFRHPVETTMARLKRSISFCIASSREAFMLPFSS
jgi:hypothetical protein